MKYALYGAVLWSVTLMRDLTCAIATETKLRRSQVAASENPTIQLQWRLPLIVLGGTLSLVLTAVALGVIATARLQPIPKIMNVPSVYLPGNPKPDDVACEFHADENQPRCFVTYLDNYLYFNFDP